jgi:hypothetical protein
MKVVKLSLALLIIFVLVRYGTARATNYSWDTEEAPMGGSWTNAVYWAPDGIPNSRDDCASIYLDAGGGVNIETSSYISFSVNQLSLGMDNTLTIFDNMALRLWKSSEGVEPVLRNDGVIAVTSGLGGSAGVSLEGSSPGGGAPAELTWEGTGQIRLGRHSGISSTNDGVIHHGPDHDIIGTGADDQPASLNAAIVNQGEVIVEEGRLVVYGEITNEEGGCLRAEMGELFPAELEISGTIVGGTIYPQDGRVVLHGAELRSLAIGSGEVRVTFPGDWYGAIGLSAGADVLVESQQGLRLRQDSDLTPPQIHNHGIMRLDDAGNGATLTTWEAVTTFTGSGKLVLGGADSRLYRNVSGHYVNDVDHTIEGRGAFWAPIVNDGHIIAKGGELDFLATVTGSGVLAAEGDGPSATAKLDLRADVRTGDVLLNAYGRLAVEEASTLEVDRNLTFEMTNEGYLWWSSGSTLEMSGGGPPQSLEAGGEDQGAVWGGFSGNFDLENLRVENGGTYVYLVDAMDNGNRASAEAVYASSLHVAPGTTLNLNAIPLYVYYLGYPYRVVDGDDDKFGGGEIIDVNITGAPALPPVAGLWLEEPYPNPFNPATSIRFGLSRARDVRLEVLAADGRRVRTLLDAWRGEGTHVVEWDGRDDAGRPVTSGAYFCRLTAGHDSRTTKALLVK